MNATRLTVATLMMCLAFLSAVALADFDLSWHKIAGGGGSSSGGGYQLTGTIGQHEAGQMSGGNFSLTGGFWAGAVLDDEPHCPIPADLNCDGVVDVSDLLILLAAWGPCPRSGDCPADINGDGTVDVSDLLILLAKWG